MPRQARVILGNTPHHIVQRGHNRDAVFVEDRDYQFYLDNLQEWKESLGIKVYSYQKKRGQIYLQEKKYLEKRGQIYLIRR